MIDSETLRDWLERGEPVTILDIRTAADRAEWAIPASMHVDAYDALKAGEPRALADTNLPRDRPVVTVCGMGKTAALATERLRARGYDAHTLDGGMRSWSLAWNSADLSLPGGVHVIQVRRTGKGCLSYLVGADGVAAVIDAALDPEVYTALASARGWRITTVLDTHIHADHLSRSRRLAELTGAALRLPAQDRAGFPFTPVHDGDSVAVGAARLAALRAPGHTPESTCYLLDSGALFSGDTLFLAGVGRPDLEADAAGARERASALYHSLQRLLTLPPDTRVLPGHTSAPVAFNGQPVTATLATVRDTVPALRLSEAAFVEQVLARIPPTPPNHARIIALNEAGEPFAGDPTELEAGANRCAVS